jgi:hypothetical protein
MERFFWYLQSKAECRCMRLKTTGRHPIGTNKVHRGYAIPAFVNTQDHSEKMIEKLFSYFATI